MSDKKLTLQEIEDKLDIKLEYYSSSYYTEDLDQTFTNSYLEEKSVQDLIEIELEALKNGDVEKAELSHSLLKNGTKFGLIPYTDEQRKELGEAQNESMQKVIEDIDSLDENASTSKIEEMVIQGERMLSTVEKIDFRDDEYTQLKATLTEKTEELQVRFLDKYTQELESIDLENLNKEDITEFFEKYDEICELCDGKHAEEGKKQLRETLQKKVEEKINQLAEKIKGLKEHIEIPENEDKIDELQTQIEDLEDILVDFKARQDFKENWKAQKGWEGLEYYNEKQRYTIKGTDKDRYVERYRQDYRKVHNHREMRMREQGKDMPDIMSDIASYRDNGRGVDDYNFASRNSEVAKKTQYLEGKLAILRQHEDIEGNVERIAQIEQELESMQDAWVIAQRGYNNIDGNIQYANEQIKSIQGRIAYYQEELKNIEKGTRAYDQKLKQIERANEDIKIYESRIDRLTQTKDEIESGENPTFMGKHHRDRYNHEQDKKRQAKQEAKERLEQEARTKKEQEERVARARAEQEEKAREREKQDRMNKAQAEYGLGGIKDKESLQHRLEDVVSKGIHYGASDSPSQKKKFETFKMVVPDFEKFKEAYLQLRVDGIEDKLYEGLDFENVSYGELLKRATLISQEEQTRKQEEQAKMESKVSSEIKQSIETVDETMQPLTRETQITDKTIQTLAEKPKIQIEQPSSIVEQTIKQTTTHARHSTDEVFIPQQASRTAKTYEQPQLENIRPQEESIRDEIGDQFKDDKHNLQEKGNPTVDLWMNRFSNWYNSIDRFAQNVKAKLVRMKSDIVNAISNTLKERMHKKQQNQDPSER